MNIKTIVKSIYQVLLRSLSVLVIGSSCIIISAYAEPEIEIDESAIDTHFFDDIMGDDDVTEDSSFNQEIDMRGLIACDVFEKMSGNVSAVKMFFPEFVSDTLWNKTYYPRTRDVLYLLPHERMLMPKEGGLFMYSFFEKSNNVTVPLIDTLSLNLNIDSIRGVLCDFINNGTDVDSLIHLLPFFKQLTTEERKSGAIFNVGFTFGQFTAGVDTSILLVERNLFASPRIENEILDAIDRVFPDAGQNSSFDTTREFARIRIGLGDTRVRLGYNAVDRRDFRLALGINGIFPTGLRGVVLDGRFMSPSDIEANNQFDFLVNPPRRILINPRLGNDGHFGFGTNVEAFLSLYDHSLDVRGRVSFDHFFGAYENRLIMSKKRLTPEDVKKDLTLIDEFFREYITPPVYRAKVNPGGIFMAVLGLDYHFGKWTFTGGYDFYLQQRETFGTIKNGMTDLSAMRLEDALQGSLWQQKGTVALRYETRADRNKVKFGIGGDWSFQSHNMADTWTAYMILGIDF